MQPSAAFYIHRLGPDDVRLMEAMMTTFGEVFGERETCTGARPGAAYLKDLLGGSHFVALAALKEGAVVGGLTAYALRDPPG